VPDVVKGDRDRVGQEQASAGEIKVGELDILKKSHRVPREGVNDLYAVIIEMLL